MDPQVNESEGKLVCFSYRSKENKVTEVERAGSSHATMRTLALKRKINDGETTCG